MLSSTYSFNKILELNERQNNYNLSTQMQIATIEYITLIDNFFKLGSDGYFKGEKGISIYYKYFLQNDIEIEKGAILISNGRRESVIKYKELIYDLYKTGYSVCMLDHRGQGFSERINTADKQMGHIDDFEYYVSDLKKYYDTFVKINGHKKIFLLAHSMGATIGTRYIEKYPRDFDSAAFSSPMFGLRFPACMLVGLFTGAESKYLIGERNFDTEERNFLRAIRPSRPGPVMISPCFIEEKTSIQVSFQVPDRHHLSPERQPRLQPLHRYYRQNL